MRAKGDIACLWFTASTSKTTLRYNFQSRYTEMLYRHPKWSRLPEKIAKYEDLEQRIFDTVKYQIRAGIQLAAGFSNAF